MSLLTLFVSSFAAATLLPVASEVLLLGLLIQGEISPPLLWGVATLGNSLGAVVNWTLGRLFLHYRERRWFPFSEAQQQRYQHWFQRYGIWSLLFAWLPVAGDVLTFIAGAMRVGFVPFLLLVAAGKGGRYALILLFASGLTA
ncbi:MAG: DedA family protein [Gammaproteobacteria bacterium]|nr:DedA family protein [Gammaproteobacteria bacterium]